MVKRPLIILTGPTAVGKTALSIGLAKRLGCEIISADSMQVYRGMDIGTAKISPKEMQGVPHYMIDLLEPVEDFNVMLFQKKCKEVMEQIYERGRIPLIVGGTGFYIQSILYDIDFDKTEADSSYRQALEEKAGTQGNAVLHQMLIQVDPVSAKSIHPNNVKRVIRALEYYHQTGNRISEHNEEQHQKASPYRFVYYVLTLPRPILYERINRRVDQMREQGLTEEVKRLMSAGCRRAMVSMQGLGYKQLITALEDGLPLDEAYERIKLETRHFAKRQFTWFKKERDVTWIDKTLFETEEALLDHCVTDLTKRLKL